MSDFIDFYNDESSKAAKDTGYKLSLDTRKIKWSSSLSPKAKKGIQGSFDARSVVRSVYRPFTKQWLYFDAMFNHRVGQMHSLFPTGVEENRVIAVTGVGENVKFSALMTNHISELKFQYNSQCFPLKLYEKQEIEGGLFGGQSAGEYTEKDGITDEGLAHFDAAYPSEIVTKEDIFYYTYGLLHSRDYRERFDDNLSKELPRIPCVKVAKDFWSFVEAGRKLGALHVDYEGVEPYPVSIEGSPQTDADYKVEKMKFGKTGKEKDKSTVIYNDHITIKDIPLEAYDYVVNGKAALDWVMERQAVRADKASGIVNDANLYAIETVGDAAYPLNLFQRIITVSLETMKIVNAPPKLDIEAGTPKK